MPALPTVPAIRLELVEDLSPSQVAGFLRLVRRRYRAHYPDGVVSEPFTYDAVHREALDAVVIAAHYQAAGSRYVYLRSALRPPLLLREPWRVGPGLADPGECGLWELPAGVVELGEARQPQGAQATACRELLEELGFGVRPEQLRPLGQPTHPAPGIIGEQHYFFEVQVQPAERQEPILDGSALERGGLVAAVELRQAMAMCLGGQIRDTKTELGLRRLAEQLR